MKKFLLSIGLISLSLLFCSAAFSFDDDADDSVGTAVVNDEAPALLPTDTQTKEIVAESADQTKDAKPADAGASSDAMPAVDGPIADNNSPESKEAKKSETATTEANSKEEKPKPAAEAANTPDVESPVKEKAAAKLPKDHIDPTAESESEKQAEKTAEKEAESKVPTAKSTDEKTPASKAVKSIQSAPRQPLPKVKPEITPALTKLRDQIRRTLAIYQKMPFNTRQNNVGEIIDFCLPFGCSTEISIFDNEGEKRANGLTCLCWNYPCEGHEPLTVCDGHIAARLGYGTQSRPAQLLATLAFARVQTNYPLRVEKTVRTVADLVESEKLSCRSGGDMSLKLIGLSYYLEDETWKNNLGEEWSLERMIKEELALPVLTANNGGLDRLLSLSYAVYRRDKRELPLNGQYARAEKYVAEFQKYAFSLQNSDGSWGYLLTGRGANRDASLGMLSSGLVLEWLALSMSDDQLGDQRLAAGVNYLNYMLNSQSYLNNLPVLSSRDISGTMHALHAMSIYDERLFKAADSEKSPTETDKPTTPSTALHFDEDILSR